MVVMHTGFGGTRMIDMLVGDPLPRICWNAHMSREIVS